MLETSDGADIYFPFFLVFKFIFFVGWLKVNILTIDKDDIFQFTRYKCTEMFEIYSKLIDYLG